MSDVMDAGARAASERLNRDCFCLTLDTQALHEALHTQTGAAPSLLAARPHLFSPAQVFLPEADGAVMRGVVAAVEAAVATPQYREAVLAWAPRSALADPGPRGAFMGFDFHIAEDGPRLIEINTNAGGAFLNALLARAQIACCAEVERGLARLSPSTFERAVAEMFEAEWRAQRGGGRPRRIAIVDDSPAQQYLYPEFQLAQQALIRAGMEAVIVDATALQYCDGRLTAGGAPIDLVYNRLVDFGLDAPEHAALRAAYLDEAVVVTPNPRNHALFADKRNLTLLSDPEAMLKMGASAEHARSLSRIAKTRAVTRRDADALWSDRASYYFKPVAGHGGKAVYRGEKLTKAVWAAILESDYVAQELVRPSERTVVLDGQRVQRKLDVRLYTYAGEVLLAAARLYQGQTTNFRTPGGGFAPVYFI